MAVAIAAVCAAPAAAHDPPEKDAGPLVVGHRGAPGYYPDHTLPGYRLAIRRGADYVEPDLVATKDGVLIARHEPNITATTERRRPPGVRRPRRRTGVDVDGAPEDGWFASDFTWAEIKHLASHPALARAARQRFNGSFPIPSLQRGHRPWSSASRKR